jgi:hypothetical protein
MKVAKQLTLLVIGSVVGAGVLVGAQAAKPAAKSAAEKPRVFFIEPKNNATVSSPLH